MKKALAILALVIVIALAVVAYFFVPHAHAPTAQQTVSSQMKTYQNAEYGYTLSYPASLDVKEYQPNDVVFGHIQGDTVNGVVETRVLTVNGAPGSTFEQSVAHELQNLCAADGPNESFSCTGVKDMQPFTTDSGLSGYRIMLIGTLKNLKTGTSTEIDKGPYFVFMTRTSATGSAGLSIEPPLNLSANEADAAIITAVAKSLKLNAPASADTALSQYISAHLAELSPQKPVLGGSFYITKLEAHGGSGTVWYEDGHIALVADFTYTMDESGNVHVDSFKVRS